MWEGFFSYVNLIFKDFDLDQIGFGLVCVCVWSQLYILVIFVVSIIGVVNTYLSYIYIYALKFISCSIHKRFILEIYNFVKHSFFNIFLAFILLQIIFILSILLFYGLNIYIRLYIYMFTLLCLGLVVSLEKFA